MPPLFRIFENLKNLYSSNSCLKTSLLVPLFAILFLLGCKKNNPANFAAYQGSWLGSCTCLDDTITIIGDSVYLSHPGLSRFNFGWLSNNTMHLECMICMPEVPEYFSYSDSLSSDLQKLYIHLSQTALFCADSACTDGPFYKVH